MTRTLKRWTDEEVNILKENLHLTYNELSKLIDRSISSIQRKTDNLGLLKEREKAIKSRSKWTNEDVEYLEKNYPAAPFEEMTEYLNRSERAIRLKANSLGIARTKREYTRWTREDVLYLQGSYGYIDTESIARKLGKSIESVRHKAYKLNLFKHRIEEEYTCGVKLKCTYTDNGQKKSRDIHYPTERSEKKATERAIDCLTKMMKYTDVKVVGVERL